MLPKWPTTAVSTSPRAGTAALARMIGQAWRATARRVRGVAGMADMMPRLGARSRVTPQGDHAACVPSCNVLR